MVRSTANQQCKYLDQFLCKQNRFWLKARMKRLVSLKVISESFLILPNQLSRLKTSFFSSGGASGPHLKLFLWAQSIWGKTSPPRCHYSHSNFVKFQFGSSLSPPPHSIELSRSLEVFVMKCSLTSKQCRGEKITLNVGEHFLTQHCRWSRTMYCIN